MNVLNIDIETYSSYDLKSGGVYKYVEAPDFEVLLFAYSLNDGPATVVDLANSEKIPPGIMQELYNPDTIKCAFNANFERVCINKYLAPNIPIEQWHCTMVKSSMVGLPHSLDQVARILHLQEQKNASGKTLIRYFCMPCKPTKVNGNRTRNLPAHDPEKWQEFKKYCIQDVVVEREIRNKISFFTIPKQEKELWALDQLINDAGILLDPVFINNAVRIDYEYKDRLTKEAVELTGLDNPNSVAQLKTWIGNETGTTVTSLNKTDLPALLKTADTDILKRVIAIRQELGKTSVKKYTAMESCICSDNRVRGLVQFYGAGRTGRWAGRLIQVQNLPRIELKDLDLARNLVKQGDGDMLELLFGNVPDTLSQLIRTSFIAPKGSRFMPADFSAIEARVIAWLANERWRLDVFNTHGKIYEASASQMFKVPIEQITKGSPLRQKGKVSELALGYQGGPNALITMGALDMGLTKHELPALVKMWRNANRNIVALWNTVEEAAIKCVQTKSKVRLEHGIEFSVNKGILFIELPSGRKLSYMRPALKVNKLVHFQYLKDTDDFKAGHKTTLAEATAWALERKGIGERTSEVFEKHSLIYEGMNQTTKQWCKQDTYGGKLVENIVQAVARDCLADVMLRITAKGYKIVAHVHDEVILEVPNGFGSTEEVNSIMGQTIPWAKGLPLNAESYETPYYKKD